MFIDASGNNINGVVNGAVLATDAAGNANSAYQFNGTTSFISLPFSSKYDFAPTDSFSIAAWVQPYANTIYAASALVVKSPFTSNYLASMWNYGLYTVNNKAMSGWAGNNIINGTTTMQTSQCWYHLAVTYKNGTWYLYVNGQVEAQDVTQTHFIIQDGSNSTIAFGRKGEASGDYYKGKMDEIRIYNRNLNPAEVKALYDMYNAKPEFSFSQDICNPKQITFKNETGSVSSFNWDFGNNTTNNSSTNPIVNYASYNNYNVKLVVANLSGCKDSVVKNIPVITQFANGLIKNIDTTICNGTSFKLNVQDSGLAYCWSASSGTVTSNSANIAVAPTTSTTYYYNTQVLGTNLIVNGDFENGNTGFTSDYTYETPPNTIGGTYYVGTNPKVWNGGMNACSDHSSGVGKMLLVNGSSTLNTQVWKSVINTISNTNYAFSVWVQSVHPANPAQLKFSINGIQLGQIFQANATPCNWNQFYIVWNSGNNTTANISLVNQNTQTNGNDFALDDISFAPVLIKTDSVKVDVVNCPILPCISKAEFSFTQDICNPKQITFKNEAVNVSTFSWDFGNNTTNNSSTNPIVNYSSYNNYNVKLVVTSINGCKDSVIKNIPVTTQFVNGLIKNIDTTICNGSSFKLNVQDSGLVYCWSASNGTVVNYSSNIAVAPTTNTTYYYNSQVLGTNLIVNGNFEIGNTGFTSDYIYQPPPNTTEGVYYIGANPQAWNAGAYSCSDHSGTGKMMMINGSPTPNISIWKETISITPNTNYAFSCWLQSIYPVNPAQLKFSINGIQVGQLLQATSTQCNWKQLYIVWNSGNNTSANISIVNQNTQVQGNDFALDDISFAPVLILTDSVNVTVNDCPVDPCKSWLKASSNPSYIECGNINIAGNKLTVEAKFNSTSSINTANFHGGKIVSKHTNPSDCNYSLMDYTCEITTQNTGYINTPPVCLPSLDKQYHVAMVYDGSLLKFYRDGILMSQIAASGNLVQNNLLTAIAQGSGASAGALSQYFGLVNEVRIWDVARSQQQIQQYMNDTLSNPTTQIGLQAYYTFNSLKNKQGNTAFDGVLKGVATINETNPQCNFVVDSCGVVVSCNLNPNFTFTQNICNPKQIAFNNQTSNTASLSWDFGNNTTDKANNNPTVNYASYNNYNVKLVTTSLSGCKDSITKNVAVNVTLDTSLIINKDTSICLGATFKINVKDTGLAYCWSASTGSVISNATSQTVTPATNTVYYFNSKTIGTNLVVNGDFEAGNTGLTSEYSYKAPPRTSQSQYYIGTNPNVWFNPFVACKDHTSNGGDMMMFDGSATANTAMWKQTISIQPNTDYLFSGWLQSIVAQDPAQIILKINGTKVGATTTANLSACSWKQFSAIWNSGNNSVAGLTILDSNIAIQGNDFAIDDISFAPIIIKTDSIKVDVTNCNVNNACKGVVELHGHDKVTPPAPIKKYFAATGFTWETWFNGSYYVNENTTIDTRSKLISALDIPQCQDIVLGFGWPQVAQKNTLCFVADGPNGCTDRDNTPCTYFPAGGFQPNTWYHVAAVRDYANNTSKLYVNGTLVDSKINNHGPINPTLLPGFIFGSWTGLGSTDSGFAGKMDEIRIWNQPRTAAEIQANYNKCLSGNETGLVAYYHANEKTGNLLHDVSTNANNAALSSTATFNKALSAPITNPCLLTTTSSFDTAICQGQTYWGHNISGTFVDTLFNVLGCDSLRTLNLTVKNCTTIPIASFTAPDTVCVNAAVNINNTSTGATTYNWNFCNAGSNAPVIAGNNLGNIGGNFSVPVFMDYVFDNGNYYGFVVNWQNSSLVRLDFGNSLLNIPTSIVINTQGQLPSLNGAEDIRLIKQNGKWFGFIVGGSPTVSSNPSVIIKLEFGVSIINITPIVTNWGNIGNMEQPHQLYMWQQNSNWYGFVFNAVTNSLTRVDFTNSFNNTPIGINLGAIGNLFYPSNFDVVNDNGTYRIFVTNTKNNTLSRLDFGNSLLNTPTGINLGTIGGVLSFPRGIRIENSCDEIYGYICNQTGNDITRINFANSLLNIPTAISLGNIGNLNNPISFSKTFIVGNNKYFFVPNANTSNTISLLKFSGCNNSNIPNSSAQTPPSLSYNAPGTYNINLTIDDGLATQSVFCKKVVVVLPKKDSVNYTICAGQSYLGHSSTEIYRDTFKTSSCDSIRILNLKVLPALVTTLDTIPASCGSVLYNGNVYLTNILVTTKTKNYLGCDSIIEQHQIIVSQSKRDTFKVAICNGQSYLGYNVSGVYKADSVRLSSGCDSISMVKLSVDKYIKDSVNISICYGDKYGTHQYAGIYYDTLTSSTFCDTIRTINLSIKTKLNPKLLDDASICEKDSIVLNPGNFYSYLWNTNASTKTINAKSVGTYWVQVADSFGCKARDTFNLITINPLPKDFLPNSLSVCDGEQYTLTGYISYNWMTGETTPTISLTTLPLYSVKVTDTNGCNGSDSMKVNYIGSLNIQSINAFSPNGDGVNETFKPFSGSCIVSYSMKIFDRWGQLLFETTNPNTGWNGMYKGSILQTAVYYYIINYKNLLGIDNRKAGSITLLR